MEQTLENIRNRVDAFGVGEPDIFLSGEHDRGADPGARRQARSRNARRTVVPGRRGRGELRVRRRRAARGATCWPRWRSTSTPSEVCLAGPRRRRARLLRARAEAKAAEGGQVASRSRSRPPSGSRRAATATRAPRLEGPGRPGGRVLPGQRRGGRARRATTARTDGQRREGWDETRGDGANVGRDPRSRRNPPATPTPVGVAPPPSVSGTPSARPPPTPTASLSRAEPRSSRPEPSRCRAGSRPRRRRRQRSTRSRSQDVTTCVTAWSARRTRTLGATSTGALAEEQRRATGQQRLLERDRHHGPPGGAAHHRGSIPPGDPVVRVDARSPAAPRPSSKRPRAARRRSTSQDGASTSTQDGEKYRLGARHHQRGRTSTGLRPARSAAPAQPADRVGRAPSS